MEKESIPTSFNHYRVFSTPDEFITKISWSPCGRYLASGSYNRIAGYSTLYVWDIYKEATQNIQNHQGLYLKKGFINGIILGIAWSPDSYKIAISTTTCNIIIYGVESTKLIRTLYKHSGDVNNIVWSPIDEMKLASCSRDSTIILWYFWEPECILDRHTHEFTDLAWSPDGTKLASSSADNTLSIWELKSKKLFKTINLNGNRALSITWAQDSEMLITGLNNSSILFWNIISGKRNIVEGHTGSISSVSLSHDGNFLVTRSLDDCSIRLWRYETLEVVVILNRKSSGRWRNNIAFNPKSPILAVPSEDDEKIELFKVDFQLLSRIESIEPYVSYINVKAILVGESGVGKTALGLRMITGEFHLTESTHGTNIWNLLIDNSIILNDNEDENEKDKVSLELTLWDFAGQEDYRLIHQLFLVNTQVALLLFDGSSLNDPFRGIPYWSRVLERYENYSSKKLLKYLVAARCDTSTMATYKNEIEDILNKYSLNAFFITSAKTGEGVGELTQKIFKDIPWNEIVPVKTPRLFKMLKELILKYKQENELFISFDEFKKNIYQYYPDVEITDAKINKILENLESQGIIFRIDSILRVPFILLKPELISKYAAFIIQSAKKHPDGLGAVPERNIITCNLKFPDDFERLPLIKEKILLESTAELLIKHELCLRDMEMLIFPSLVTLSRPFSSIDRSNFEITYSFSGNIEAIYASLVIRLSYTERFKRENLWKNTAEFSRGDAYLGFSLNYIEAGYVNLNIYFSDNVIKPDRITFIRFITEHLYSKGIYVEEKIWLNCLKCHQQIDKLNIEKQKSLGKSKLYCHNCGTEIKIPNTIEEYYDTDKNYYSEASKTLLYSNKDRADYEARNFFEDAIEDYESEQASIMHILHLSDIHLQTVEQANTYLSQIESDLKKTLNIYTINYLVISGDIANFSILEEYDAAYEMFDKLIKAFNIKSDRIIIAPGNHDLNLELSKRAYKDFIYPNEFSVDIKGTKIIPLYQGDKIIGWLKCNEAEYLKRFDHFCYFYKKIIGNSYSKEYKEQGILHSYPEDRLQFLSLNSSWELDHYFTDRSGINQNALNNLHCKLIDKKYDGWLKIAVWHHPVTGPEQIKEKGFLEQLVQYGFQIGMHGHIHEAQDNFFRYDVKHGMRIIGAGTFGAPASEQVQGIPYQYNILVFNKKNRNRIIVHTRKKDKPGGIWSADARWGDKGIDPKPEYTIKLNNEKFIFE